MIEIFRKGFRLDIPTDQVITFKKAQNLNGIQARYAYSNTGSMDKTANNKKLLELFDLPTNKVNTLMNGFTVDVILNGSIQLRNQTLTLQKETLDKVNWYLLYTDNSLVVKLKETYINEVVKGFKYKKTFDDFYAKQAGVKSRSVLIETQPKSGLFVMEEMPLALQVREVVKLLFEQNGYSVYGDFFIADSPIEEFYIAGNKGIYEIYSGLGEGFSPSFDETLDAYKFLTDILVYFNCYADVDDTYKTVVVNRWTNLGNYKTSYVDYSKHYENYQDYAFQSKLAKRNEMTYSDSGTAYNSFFPNNLSSQDKATYIASAFGTGAANLFDDSDIEDNGHIPLRANGAVGETSAVRMFKISATPITTKVYIDGAPVTLSGLRAIPVSMRDVYTEFHKEYTDFILTPLVANIVFTYDEIMAADFSMTKVFFVEQLSSYWIPLEINFSTKKDKIIVKAMLVKKRKVESPILNNFNSIELDFKEKALFPLELLKSMYPMPPNNYPWDVVIFKRYDQDKNRLYVNDILIPADSLPQAFSLADISTIKIEANKPSDTGPDKNTDSLYIEAIDTNGGISNEAYITIKHTGVASLQSDFKQNDPLSYQRLGFDIGGIYIQALNYITGPKPNLNTTITTPNIQKVSNDAPDDSFNLINVTENYSQIKVEIPSFNLYLKTDSNGIGKARAHVKLIIFDGTTELQVYETGSANNQTQNIIVPAQSRILNNIAINKKIRVYLKYEFDNRRGSNSGSMNVFTTVSNMRAIISTTKII